MYSFDTLPTDAPQPPETASLLDMLPIGIILLNEHGHAVQVNRLAEQLLSRGDGLYLRYKELRASRSSESSRLRQLVRSVLTRRSDAGTARLPILSISRCSGRRALEVLVLPFSCTTLTWLGEDPPKIVVLVRDPERRLANCRDRLKTLYGLTPVEAGVAESVAQGKTVGDLAEELHVQPNTIRVHLKHIYCKTTTRRQNELVSLLAGDFLLHIPVVVLSRAALSA